MSPREAAEQVHRRLSADPRWTGSDRLPSVDRLVDAVTAMFETWPIAGDARLEQLQTLIEPGLHAALAGPPAGRPVLAVDNSTDQFTVRVQEIADCDQAYLIIAHPGFFPYLSLIVRAVAACLPSDFLQRPYDLDDLRALIDARIQTDPERTIFSFAEAAVVVAIDGSVERVGSFPVDPEWLPMTKVLWDATDLFVLGHEYAHFELGHDGPPRPAIDRLGAAHASDPYHFELQADELGLSISAWALHGLGVPLQHASLGSWMAFTAMSALDLATAILDRGSRRDGEAVFHEREQRRSLDDYPSGRVRRATIHDLMKGNARGHDEVLGQLWGGCGVAFDRLMDYLAAHAESVAATGVRSNRSRRT